MSIAPEQLIGKKIAVRVLGRTLYGVGEDRGDSFRVECTSMAFEFEKEFWDNYDIRVTPGEKKHEFIILVKQQAPDSF